jgi:hypothetical protein
VEVQFESWSIWMDYVASLSLGNLVRFRSVLENLKSLHLCCPVSSTYYHTSEHVQLTLNDVLITWANVVCGDGLADVNLTESSEICRSGGLKLLAVQPSN